MICATRLFLLSLLCLLVACDAVRTSANWDTRVDFDRLDTWCFAATPGPDAASSDYYNDATYIAAVRKAIETDLVSRGFALANSKASASFQVRFLRVVTSRVSVESVNTFAGYDTLGWGMGIDYGIDLSDGPEYTQTSRLAEYTNGSLIIDISTDDGKTLAWRGIGTSDLPDTRKPDPSQKTVQAHVQRILARFPPGPGDVPAMASVRK